MRRQQDVVEMERAIARANMERHNVEVFRGAARLKDAHTVSFVKPDGTEDDVTGEIILIATGSSPFRQAGIPFDNHRIYDSDSILRMKMIPKTFVDSEIAGAWVFVSFPGTWMK